MNLELLMLYMLAAVLGFGCSKSADPNMSFFLTSNGPGEGANLGGIAGADGNAQLGHHDRTGGGDNPNSWNSAHGSRGCSQKDLEGTGGSGLFYCFAID